MGIAARYMWPDTLGLQVSLRRCCLCPTSSAPCSQRAVVLPSPCFTWFAVRCALSRSLLVNLLLSSLSAAAAPSPTCPRCPCAQLRASVCVVLVAVLRLLNLLVPVLYKKVIDEFAYVRWVNGTTTNCTASSAASCGLCP